MTIIYFSETTVWFMSYGICLKPFAECSNDLSGQSYPLISFIIPYISALYDETTLKTDPGRESANHLLEWKDTTL